MKDVHGHLVRASWERSHFSGVDAERAGADVALTGEELRTYRDAHPLSPALPVIRRLLVEDAAEAGVLVAVSDEQGRLLWVEGDTTLRDRAAGMTFAEGADWSESSIGTNAPGTALVLDRCTQIDGAEHFTRAAQRWSCTAAPVHDRTTGAILGTLDITGGPRAAGREMRTLLRAAVVATEAELQLHTLSASATRGEGAGRADCLRMRVLGREAPTLARDAAVTALSPRHAEILVILSAHPDGLSTDELALQLDERVLDPVTVRVEMSRLRRVLGADALASRPYRLTCALDSDLQAVESSLEAADVATALRRYRGPLLPNSFAPGVVDARAVLEARLRTAVVNSADPRLLTRWAATPEGRSDPAIWRAVVARTPARSPAHIHAAARVEHLDQQLSSSATPLQRPRI